MTGAGCVRVAGPVPCRGSGELRARLRLQPRLTGLIPCEGGGSGGANGNRRLDAAYSWSEKVSAFRQAACQC